MSDSVSNSSRDAGYLVPTSPDPLEDAALDDLFTALLAGVTGLDPTLVRPRWQPRPATQPEPSVNWASVGVTRHAPIDYPFESHDPADPDPADPRILGSSSLWRWERLDVLASFYGPNAHRYADLARDGLYIAQNREAIGAAGVKLTGVDEAVTVPDLTNAQWIDRVDVPFRFVRQYSRTYAIRNIIAATVTFAWDGGVRSFAVLPGSIGAYTIAVSRIGFVGIVGG